MQELLGDLVSRGLSCAPHVLSRLVAELHADAATIREVATRLQPVQRSGLWPLPTPLPLVPTIARVFDDLTLPARDRDLLLAAAICLDDGLEALIDFDGRSASEIAAAPIGRHLLVGAGRARFADARLVIWLCGTTEAAVIRAVQDRLSGVFRVRGDHMSAHWHRARASLERQPDTAAALTRFAGELSKAGRVDRALLLAREATKHAVGEHRDEAMLIAGSSSIGAGFAVEAAGLLGSLFPRGTEHSRLQGLAALITVRTHLQGTVPHVSPGSLRPRTDSQDDWYSWTRAAAVATVFCAARGDRIGMRQWMEALQVGTARVGAERELRDPAVALSWLLVGERDVADVEGSGPITGRILPALRAAMAGDVDLGLRTLGASDSTWGADTDPLVAGFEHSPVVHAYRAVVEVLLLVWRGDIGLARERLALAAFELPIAIPFAGLGVVLARRLDLAVLGELGPISRALTAALPPAAKIDMLVDRGIRSFLDGSFDDAAASMRLWFDLGGRQASLSVPGLDEVALSPDRGSDPPAAVAPPEILLAQELHVRIARASDSRWRTEHDEIHAVARTLRSPFERARIEAMLGTRCAIRDERAAARGHLESAQRLFELSGADAWARSIIVRRARVEEDNGDIAGASDPLTACRHAWSLVLTAREVEVAMLAVAGSGNRDIAMALGVSVRTVEVHLGRVFAKLDVRKRVELTALAHRTNQHL